MSRHALGANDLFRPAYISSIVFGLTALYHEDLCSMSFLYSEHMTAGRFAWFGCIDCADQCVHCRSVISTFIKRWKGAMFLSMEGTHQGIGRNE
jgi:hypothetical protein